MKPWLSKLDSKAVFNMGSHAGRVWYASTKCGGEVAPRFKHIGGLARLQLEPEFTKGFKAGVSDSERNHKLNGREIGCKTSLMLYGPAGTNVADAWLPPAK